MPKIALIKRIILAVAAFCMIGVTASAAMAVELLQDDIIIADAAAVGGSGAIFTRFLDDGRICLFNNAAERALRGVALGRRNWTFAGSDRGGQRAAAIYTLIETAKLNDIDPRDRLADVLRRINDHPAARLDELLPWNWKAAAKSAIAA